MLLAVPNAFWLLKNEISSEIIAVFESAESNISATASIIFETGSIWPPRKTMYACESANAISVMIAPTTNDESTYPPAILPLPMGDAWKSLMILCARSSTIVPNAPITVVTDITASSPAMIQLSVSAFAPTTFGSSCVHTSPRNSTYSASMISTDKSEKNTDALSRKNTFRLRNTNDFMAESPFR